MEQSKAKDAEMKAKGIKGSASLYKAEPASESLKKPEIIKNESNTVSKNLLTFPQQ